MGKKQPAHMQARTGPRTDQRDKQVKAPTGPRADQRDPATKARTGPRTDQRDPPIEARIIAIAARQHGVIKRSQLLDVGLPLTAVDKRVRSKRLLLLHRGVYLLGTLVGPLEPPRAKEMAAVLACGPGAVVSHQSAARLWGLLPLEDDQEPVHVTVPGSDRGRRKGICPHRVSAIQPEDRAVLDGVPVTAPVRTLVDVATWISPRALEQAIAMAERKELATLQEVAAALEQGPRRNGASRIQQLTEGRNWPAFTRSAAEERLLALIRKGGLPPPQANARVEGSEVDFLWPSERVVVEVDGFAFHASRRPFENDRRRDAKLAALGFRIFRVTWRQLTDEPYVVLVRLAQVLAHSMIERPG